MKKSDIKVGSTYEAKISGGATIVKVNTIEEYEGRSSKAFNGRIKLTEYHCTNMETGRRVVLRSAAKFIKEAVVKIIELDHGEIALLERDQREAMEASEEVNPTKSTNVDTAKQVTPSVQNVTVSDSTESGTRIKLYPHPFVSTPNDGPCSSCNRKRSDRIHNY